MSKEFAKILPAIIGVAASLLTLLITRIYDAISEKRKEQERFFYEVFPKRVELYEEIIRVTSNIGDTEGPPPFKSKQELLDFYSEKCNALAVLIYRSNIFGSTQVVGALVMLHESLDRTGALIFALPEPLDKTEVYVLFRSSCMPGTISVKNRLLEFIREESGVYMIDKKTDDFLRDIKKKKSVSKNSGKDSRTTSYQKRG